MDTTQLKIYDMTLRDGLQSLKSYPLETKIECVNEIFKNDFYYIDYGTITNNNSNKQMHNSDKILEHIKNNFPNTKIIYGILIPNISLFSYEIIQKNNAFSLLCTIDEIYSQKNFKKSASDNFKDVLEMLETILRYCLLIKKIRIYIACAFNNNNNNNNNKLYDYTVTIINIVKKYNSNSDLIDIVFADTFNEVTPNMLFDTLSLFTSEKKKYIGLHLHCGDDFKEILNICFRMKIYKIDSGLCNIGTCNFVKNKKTNYLSTIDLVKYIKKKEIDIELLENTEKKLIDILNIIY